MIGIVCIDLRNGLSFNGRRTSRDRIVIEDILSYTEKRTIWALPYSIPLFPQGRVKEWNSDSKAEDDDYFFIELEMPDLSFDQLVVYRWDKRYPYDEKVDLSAYRFIVQKELEGNSHEVIMREVYEHA
ncbi:MAG: hypothetical protein J6E46_05510 [Faecalicoccus sp.]|nr:hypothetical protein [Faecalicoccus sp.]